MSNTCKFISLCNALEVPQGAAVKLEKEGLTLAVFNVDGAYFVTQDACTHGLGSLSEGDIVGDVVECNFHGGAFNIRTGEVVSSPCSVPLKIYKTRLQGGSVEFEI